MKIRISRNVSIIKTDKVTPATSRQRLTVLHLAEMIEAGKRTLFAQLEKSNAFTSWGRSQIAEAAIAVHIASAFIQKKHAVWPESPFRKSKRSRTNHLDLLIDLEPGRHVNPRIVTLEAKAVSPGRVADKVKEIVEDQSRICDWASLWPKGKPIFFSLSRPKIVKGILLVLTTEPLAAGKASAPDSLSEWWKKPAGSLAGVSKRRTEKLRLALSTAARSGVFRCRLKDAQQISLAYAIFRCKAKK